MKMSSVCCVAYAGMVCDLDKTSGRSCILRSSPIADTFSWTCMLINYHLSSDDVKLTLNLLADSVTILTYTLCAKVSAKWIENPHHGSSISIKFTASRYSMSTEDYEYALVSSVAFLPCPSDRKLLLFYGYKEM